jgi:DNA-binding CsgD family transcriptional regulator
MYRMIVLQVKEMLELKLTAYEIAHRLHINVDTVNAAIEIIKLWDIVN